MTQPFDLTIDAESRRVVLRAEQLGIDSPWPIVRDLVGRLLSSPAVLSVDIDRRTGTATLLHDANAPDRLRSIAQGLRHPSEPRHLLVDAYAPCKRLVLQKSSLGIVAGTITSQIPGRVRIRHPLLLRNPELIRRVESVLAAIPGIGSVSASPLTGSVLVLFRTGTITPGKLLSALERIIDESDDAAASLASPPVSHWLAAGTCLGLAVATVAQPALAPVTAAALVCSNLPTLSRGVVELCTFRWKVASLYTVIMGTTLATGQFLAAAVMLASITGWHAWANHRLRKVVRDLTALPHSAESIGELFTDVIPDRERIKVGMVMNVPEGALLPFDGIIVSGAGDLDEHGVRGVQTPAHRISGDAVYAGSVLLQGNMQVKVLAVGSKTRLSAIRGTMHSLICEAIGTGGATPRGKALAGRFVPFTFATGTAALLVGDLTTLAAVLRPDFSTGPSLTDRLGALSGVSHLLHEGWLVRNCETLHALASVDTIVIASSRPPATDGAIEVRVSKLTGVARSIQIQELSCSATDFQIHVRELSRSNKNTAVVGDRSVLSQLADVDILRISMTPEQCLGQPYADLIALHAEPQRLGDLLQILQETHEPGRTAWNAILACNALAISGAFLVGLTSLHVVAITNAGVLAAGLLYERQVRKSNRLLSSHSLQKAPSPREAFVIVPEGNCTNHGAGPQPQVSVVQESTAEGQTPLFVQCLQEESGPSPPEIENPALQPVVPRHGPSYSAKPAKSRIQPKPARQRSRSVKSEGPVTEVSLLATADKTSPNRPN